MRLRGGLGEDVAFERVETRSDYAGVERFVLGVKLPAAAPAR